MTSDLENSKQPEELGELPGFLFIDHVAVSVLPGELEGQVEAYRMMGFREVHQEELGGSDQVREVLLGIGESPNLIQLVEPLNNNSPVQRQIDRNGGRGGLIHVGFRVENARTAFDWLQEKGFNLIDDAPRPGSRGTTVFFVHPKSRTNHPFGVLYEIVEDPADPSTTSEFR
ncbi:MAG TPA: glyoxalase [Deltaproteobacteria bacterium]|nr:glyoxalase [Deltaproteobacteria bacterium]